MIEAPVRTTSWQSFEDNLRAELARGDAMARTVQPVLHHLLTATDSSLFGDEILARIRGMLSHLASQLLYALPGREQGEGGQGDPARTSSLVQAMMQTPSILSHLHALSLEWQLIERLEQALGLDPVVSPLLRQLIASSETVTQELAMQLLAAQARWCEPMRRMQLPLQELPPEQFEAALSALRGSAPSGFAADAEARLRVGYDEAQGRVGAAKHLLASLGNAAVEALDISHAGVNLFITALAIGSGQTRDMTCLCTHASQTIRLGVALRAAGMPVIAAERQVLLLQPDARLEQGLEDLSAERAAAILAQAADPEF